MRSNWKMQDLPIFTQSQLKCFESESMVSQAFAIVTQQECVGHVSSFFLLCLPLHSSTVIIDMASSSPLKKKRKGMKLKILSLEDQLKVLDSADAGASMRMVCACRV